MTKEEFLVLIYEIWSGQCEEFEKHRDRRLQKAVSCILHCKENERPFISGPEKEHWDRCWLGRSLTLEMFACSKDAISILADNHTGILRPIIAKIRNVRRQCEGSFEGNEIPFLDCTLEIPVDVVALPNYFLDSANAKLREYGMPNELLLGNGAALSHIADMIFVNPCVARSQDLGSDRPNLGFVPLERDYPLNFCWNKDEAPIDELLGDQIIEFVTEGAARDLQMPTGYYMQHKLEESGLGNRTLRDLFYDRELSKKKDLYNVVLSGIHTAYANHLMGISRLEAGSNALGHFVTHEKYGRMALSLNNAAQQSSYSVKRMIQNISSSQIGETLLKFAGSDRNQEIPDVLDPATGNLASFATKLAGSTQVGYVDSSMISGTCSDQDRSAHLKQVIGQRSARDSEHLDKASTPRKKVPHLRLV